MNTNGNRWEFALAVVVLLFPFSYYTFTVPGNWIAPWFSGILEQVPYFRELHPSERELSSDTTGYFAWLLCSLLLGLTLPVRKWKLQPIARAVLLWFLVAILFRYGWDKIFGTQFPYPPDNVLHTPFGHLDSDLAFWALLGTSQATSISIGIMELAIGICLLFSSTRRIGLVLASLTFLTIFGINLCFDISVKGLSVLCTVIAFTLSATTWRAIYAVLTGRAIALAVHIPLLPFQRPWQKTSIGMVAIGWLVFETSYPQLTTPDSPHLLPSIHSYRIENSNTWRKLFIHPDNYIILQDSDDIMHSYPLRATQSNRYFFEYQPHAWREIWFEIDPLSSKINRFSLDHKNHLSLTPLPKKSKKL